MHLSDEAIDDPIVENVADNAWNATLNGEDLHELPRHWRAMRTSFWLYLEVQNGGLHQFLWNDDGDALSATLEDLSYLGAEPFRSILERAIEIYRSKGYPNRSNASQNTWTEFIRGYKIKKMERLDKEFYALYNIKSIPDYIAAYVRENRWQFQK